MSVFRSIYGSDGSCRRFIDDREVSESEWNEQSPNRIGEIFESGGTACGQSSSGWPRSSMSMGVHPSQIEKAMEVDRKLGVSADYTPRGEPIFTSPSHQRQFAKAHGYVDLCDRNNTSNPENA